MKTAIDNMEQATKQFQAVPELFKTGIAKVSIARVQINKIFVKFVIAIWGAPWHVRPSIASTKYEHS